MRTMSPRRDVLGEGPYWSVAQERLYWVDIRGQMVHRSRLDGSEHHTWMMPSDVGFAVPCSSGGVLVGLRNGLHRLDPSTGDLDIVQPVEEDVPTQRLNDGKCDRQGRLWFGSMRDDELVADGSLYRYDGDGGLTRARGDVYTSNGLGWSADGRVMYYTDSQRRCIYVSGFDPETGERSGERVFVSDPSGCLPDGLTVDAEGFVWSVKWDGGRLERYSPDGALDRRIDVPVSRPTSCMFAGSDLETLVVTSASVGIKDDSVEASVAGAIFLLDVGVSGLPEEPFLD